MEEATLVLAGLHVDPVSCSNWTLEMLLSAITLTTASSLDAISKECKMEFSHPFPGLLPTRIGTAPVLYGVLSYAICSWAFKLS